MNAYLILPVLMLTSCTLPSTLRNSQTGEMITLGGSLGTKTKEENAMAVTASGTMLAYGITGKDETVVPRYFFLEQAVGELATASRQAYSSAEATRRALGSQGVRKSAIAADKAVRLKALHNIPTATPLPN